jgi:hypothetical protein
MVDITKVNPANWVLQINIYKYIYCPATELTANVQPVNGVQKKKQFNRYDIGISNVEHH